VTKVGEELNERSRKILEAVIEDYIDGAEPVGSRAVTKRHRMGLSPATVRNVMAELEERGFLASPHTSAGRIPTEKGYRFYIDTLLRIRSLTPAEMERIEGHYRIRGLRMEGLLQASGKILSSISRYAGIVMAPRFRTTVLRHIEFIRLTNERVLVVLVSESGSVQNKIVETDGPLSPRDLEQMNNYLNRTLKGLTIQEVKMRLVAEMAREKALYDRIYQRALELSREVFSQDPGEQVFIEGAVNVLEQPEFADLERMKRLFRTFEQKSLLVNLLDKSQRVQGVQIFIGNEAEYSAIQGCSLITSTYCGRQGAVGTLGVIGPTRMPYSTVIPVVDYTARLITRLLEADS